MIARIGFVAARTLMGARSRAYGDFSSMTLYSASFPPGGPPADEKRAEAAIDDDGAGAGAGAPVKSVNRGRATDTPSKELARRRTPDAFSGRDISLVGMRMRGRIWLAQTNSQTELEFHLRGHQPHI